MTRDEAMAIMRDARNTRRATEDYANELAAFLCGRLRAYNVSPYRLEELKRELRDYNITTMSWKETT